MNSIVSFSKYSHVIMFLMKYLQVQLLSQSTSAFKFTKYCQIAVSKVMAKIFTPVGIFFNESSHCSTFSSTLGVIKILKFFPICSSRIISEVVHLIALGLYEFYTYLLLVFLVVTCPILSTYHSPYILALILYAICFTKISQPVAYLFTLFYGALYYRMHLSPNASVANYHNLSDLTQQI